MPHSSIASYVLHEVLHSGRDFTVYRAQHPVLQNKVAAAKVLHPALADRVAYREALRHQGEILAQLAHPTSVSVIDFIDDGPTCALVMSLARGRPISEQSSPMEDPLSVSRMEHILRQLLDLFAFAHNRGVVHGTLSAEDLYLDAFDRLTVLGFGACSAPKGQKEMRGDLFDISRVFTALLTRKPMSEQVPTPQLLRDSGASESLARLMVGLGTHHGPHAIQSCGEALARLSDSTSPTPPMPRLQLGAVTVDLHRHERTLNGDTDSLTGHDVALLSYFARHPNEVLSRERLLRDVWGNQGGMVTRAVDLAVGRLRKKVEVNPSAPRHILTIHGRGYRFIGGDEDTARVSQSYEVLQAPPDQVLFGRTAEVQSVLEFCMRGTRLVTLLGPSGIGKTTVARHVSQQLSGQGTSLSVLFCDAHTVTTLAGFVAIVAETLDVPMSSAPDEEVTHLGSILASLGPTLMVLDNVEQIVTVARTAITQWLHTAPQLQFLVTSQVPIEGPQEQTFLLNPLSCHDAQLLFRAAAARTAPQNLLSVEDDEDIRHIVEAVDCIPLAVELAAGRISIFSPKQIAQRLTKRFALLAGKAEHRPLRHMTLHDAIDWSWQLLTQGEQHVLAQAAVFRGGFSVEAAEAVVSPLDSEWVFDVLQRLAERSFIQTQNVEGGRRFVFLQSIQQFIQNTTLAQDAGIRHRAFFLDYVKTWAAACQRAGAKEAHRMLSLELDNILHAALLNQDETTVQLSLLLDTHLEERGPRSIHVTLMDAAIQSLEHVNTEETMAVYAARARLRRDSKEPEMADQVELKAMHQVAIANGDATLRARAVLIEADYLMLPEGRVEDASQALEAVSSLLLTQGEVSDRYRLFQVLGRIAEHQARWTEAEDYCRRALTIAQAQHHLRWEARSLQHLGLTLCNAGRTQEAEAHLENAIALYSDLGGSQGAANCMGILAELLLFRGQHDRCDALLQESITLSLKLGNPVAAAAAEGARGRVAMDMGEEGRAQIHLKKSMEGLANWPIAASVNRVHWAAAVFLLGNDKDALNGLVQAIDVLSARSYPKGRNYALHIAALASHECGDTAMGEQWLREAWALAETPSLAQRTMTQLVAGVLGVQIPGLLWVTEEERDHSLARSFECRVIFRLCSSH